MGLLLFYPTPVYEKDDAMPEDFNQRLEKKIIDYKIFFLKINKKI